MLLFRHDGHLCHNVMRELEHLLSTDATQYRVALIGIDHKVNDLQVAKLEKRGCLSGHLPQDREWFATTPLRLRLSDGACVAADVIEHWD